MSFESFNFNNDAVTTRQVSDTTCLIAGSGFMGGGI